MTQSEARRSLHPEPTGQRTHAGLLISRPWIRLVVPAHDVPIPSSRSADIDPDEIARAA